jgi:hypothetical protein
MLYLCIYDRISTISDELVQSSTASSFESIGLEKLGRHHIFFFLDTAHEIKELDDHGPSRPIRAGR